MYDRPPCHSGHFCPTKLSPAYQPSATLYIGCVGSLEAKSVFATSTNLTLATTPFL